MRKCCVGCLIMVKYKLLKMNNIQHKTIVNIISVESPLPAYLFIKERYVKGDRLLFLAAPSAKENLEFLTQFLSMPAEIMEKIVFSKEEEFSYERICRRLREELKKEEHYYVNLAGGTRYMALAIQEAFSSLHADFYYINLRDNTIVKTIYNDSIDDDDDFVIPICHRMRIGEYLSLHRMQNDAEAQCDYKPVRSAEYARTLFSYFASGRMDGRDYDVLEALRLHYRNRNSDLDMRIADIESGRVGCEPAVPGLVRLLRYIHFVPKVDEYLSKQEIGYLTGGWFEEFCYFKVKELLPVDEIGVGVHVTRGDTTHDNELDVVFIRDNQLRVIECKSGISTQKLFNEIVYKAAALKEVLLGMMCQSYIFSLKKDNDTSNLRKIAASMGITFCGHDVLTDDSKMARRLTID